MKSAFLPFDERLELINERIKPGYAEVRAEFARRLSHGQEERHGHS
jgi:adenosine deaminase